MRSDRLLSILLLLQSHGRLSARRLAETLEVTERTIHRDVEALSGAGIPVYAERGRHGGIALLPGFRTDVTGLTGPEARALFIFAGRGTLADLGLEGDLKAALRKLMAGLPEARRPEARSADRIVVDPRGWMHQSEEVAHLPAVQAAVWDSKRLRIGYRSGGGEVRDRTVDPYGLVAKAGVWYLIAGDSGEPRLYRASRIETAELLEESAHRPPNLDVEALWERLRRRIEERGEGIPVLMRVRAGSVERVLRVSASQLVGEAERLEEEAGWRRLRLTFVGEGAARGALLGFGTEAEVLEPASLRREMAEVAAAVVELYRG